MPTQIYFFAREAVAVTNKFIVLALLIVGSAMVLNPEPLQAQSSQEFIESSSPSKSGGRVTSRFVPGGQTRTTVERAIGSPTQVAANPFPQNVNPNAFSNANVAANRYQYPTNRIASAAGSGTRQQSTALRAQQTATGPTVGYAPDARPNLSQRPTQAALVAQNCQCYNTQNVQQFRNQQVVGTAPTLQLPQLQTPQFQNPQQVLSQALPQTFQNPTTVQAPQLSFPSVTAGQAPQLSFPNVTPGQAQLQFPQPPVGTGQSIFQAPNIGIPQLGGSTFGSRLANWWRPLVSGTGAYVPVVRLENMSPGVFVGQGIIGQPKAYADGQPIRNLFRYISP